MVILRPYYVLYLCLFDRFLTVFYVLQSQKITGHIHKPEYPDEAITMLPTLHYEIHSDKVDILDENEINTTAEILLKDPVGDQEVRDLLFLVAD